MNFLDYNGEMLFQGKIPLLVFEDAEAAFKDMADRMVDAIIENNQASKKTLFIVPVGPIGQYKYFVERVNAERVSLKDVTFISMDEYLDNDKNLIPESHPLSFRRIMKEKCYNLISEDLIMPEEQRLHPTPENGEYLEEVIRNHGGVDICFGGIGINGHIAFNEPLEAEEKLTEEEFTQLSFRIQKISRETKVINALNEFDGAYYLMPDYCVTIGMKQILESKKVFLYCFRPWHRSVVRRAIFGEVTSAFPVTFLQKHPDAKIAITKDIQK